MIVNLVELHVEYTLEDDIKSQKRLKEFLSRFYASNSNIRLICCEPDLYQFVVELYPQTEYIYHLFSENEDSNLFRKDKELIEKMDESIFESSAFLGQSLKNLGLLDRTYRFKPIFLIVEIMRKLKNKREKSSLVFLSHTLRFLPVVDKNLPMVKIQCYRIGPFYLKWLQNNISQVFRTNLVIINILINLRDAFCRAMEIKNAIKKRLRNTKRIFADNIIDLLTLPLWFDFIFSPRYFRQKIQKDSKLKRTIKNLVPKEKKRPKVLFVVTDTASHVNISPVGPVVKKIIKNGMNCCILFETPKLVHSLPKEIMYLGVGFGNKISVSAHNHFKKLASKLYVRIIERFKESNNDFVKALIYFQYINRLSDLLSLAYLSIYQHEVFLREYSPDIVVLLPDRTMHGQVTAQWCHRNNIPSITYPIGFMKEHACYSWFDADYIFVCGPYYQEVLEKLGIDTARIYMVGDVRYDSCFNINYVEERLKFIRQTNINPDLPILLLAAHLLHRGCELWVKELIKIIASANSQSIKYQLYIKPHPSEEVEDYKRLLPEKPFGIILNKEISFERAVLNCDVLTTDISAAGTLAVYFDKPIVAVNFTNDPYPIRYDLEGVGLLVRKKEKIIPVIERILHDREIQEKLREERVNFIKRFLCKKDGQASSRFAEKIMRLAAKNKR